MTTALLRASATAAAPARVLAGCGSPNGATRYRVDGDSMAPALKAGTTVTAQPVPKSGYAAKRGDIVVFHAPLSWPGGKADVRIKRVVGLGGETVACCDDQGRVAVNGAGLPEPYVGENAPLDRTVHCGGRRFGEVRVPADQLFVLGDSRAVSVDSACNGPIPASSVIAVVAA
ncbi:signal peptidase I [Dactylosporangium sp. CA-139066]|uniref:signal peptidase I n=1 Tax=Dactylosporangium sp. CA-139066 TaxID=3239930 RepID=UPI003D910E23